MEIKILGAHATETAATRTASLLVDGIIALDAGSLASGLTLEEQQRLKAILLTHYHYDHVKDIPMIGMNMAYRETLPIYATEAAQEMIIAHLLDGAIYPNFLEWPQEQPAIRLVTLREEEAFTVEGYSILPVPVYHSVPAVGLQVTCPRGKTLFYTGDTGAGLARSWRHVSPDLLITELSLPDRMEEWAMKSGHLTPRLLEVELEEFRKTKGYVPRTILIHMNPFFEADIALEVADVARRLEAKITPGSGGMKIAL